MQIKPEDLRKDLEEKAAAPPAAPPDASASGGAVMAATGAGVTATAFASNDLRDDILKNISASYFFLRRGMAFIALAFPIVLVVFAGIDQPQSSISAYYHFHDLIHGGPAAYGSGTTRNVFVGVLWTIGAFLFFYKGYSWKEDWALNIAGIAAIVLALCPMDWIGKQPSWTNDVHLASAIIYFLAIAFVCIHCSRDTLAAMKDEERKRRFQRTYNILGTLMVALPVGLVLLYFLSRGLSEKAHETHVVLAVEVAAIWVFAIFWLVKSREIAILEKQVR